jgi:hypothetical protein
VKEQHDVREANLPLDYLEAERVFVAGSDEADGDHLVNAAK